MATEAGVAGLDWPGLLRVGLGPPAKGGLGLSPAEFWALTPAELALMLGVSPDTGAMTRDRLAALAARFPDRKPDDRKPEDLRPAGGGAPRQL
ncbi:phage tail assembly chaperone [Paracoccus aminophilus]|uniref:phage tail assembly chaperone n=1 Tax=Paracoccus aminophilus TaxID=34003 RepID=UPI00040DEC6F